jgi:hypothetical protein
MCPLRSIDVSVANKESRQDVGAMERLFTCTNTNTKSTTIKKSNKSNHKIASTYIETDKEENEENKCNGDEEIGMESDVESNEEKSDDKNKNQLNKKKGFPKQKAFLTNFGPMRQPTKTFNRVEHGSFNTPKNKGNIQEVIATEHSLACTNTNTNKKSTTVTVCNKRKAQMQLVPQPLSRKQIASRVTRRM